jgi:hypothetical protein
MNQSPDQQVIAAYVRFPSLVKGLAVVESTILSLCCRGWSLVKMQNLGLSMQSFRGQNFPANYFQQTPQVIPKHSVVEESQGLGRWKVGQVSAQHCLLYTHGLNF